MLELSKMLANDVAQEDLAIYLNNLTHEERLQEIYALSARDQEKLFNTGKTDLKLEDLIPTNTPPGKEVIFFGANTLPTFNRFQKRMCRSQDGQWLWGYNFQSMKWLTGPGYFVVSEDPKHPGQILMDYTQIPPEEISNWPALRSNETGIARLVYGNLKDFARRVSNHILIAQATKKGKSVGYFILCRQT